MRVSNELFHNFLQCKYKAHLKLQEQAGKRSDYESMTIQLDDSYRENIQKRLKQEHANDQVLELAAVTLNDLKLEKELVLNPDSVTEYG